jgi:hypothetical protein
MRHLVPPVWLEVVQELELAGVVRAMMHPAQGDWP